MAPGCQATSDGLACFAGGTEAGCEHTAIIVGARKPKDLPQFTWVNTVLGNLKTSLGGAYHAFAFAFAFAKYGARYLATFAHRFNRRFHLDTIHARLLVAAASTRPRSQHWLRLAEESC